MPPIRNTTSSKGKVRTPLSAGFQRATKTYWCDCIKFVCRSKTGKPGQVSKRTYLSHRDARQSGQEQQGSSSTTPLRPTQPLASSSLAAQQGAAAPFDQARIHLDAADSGRDGDPDFADFMDKDGPGHLLGDAFLGDGDMHMRSAGVGGEHTSDARSDISDPASPNRNAYTPQILADPHTHGAASPEARATPEAARAELYGDGDEGDAYMAQADEPNPGAYSDGDDLGAYGERGDDDSEFGDGMQLARILDPERKLLPEDDAAPEPDAELEVLSASGGAQATRQRGPL
ncbi:hypothetical protein V8E36_000426 [Tilletia maclaganii]